MEKVADFAHAHVPVGKDRYFIRIRNVQLLRSTSLRSSPTLGLCGYNSLLKDARHRLDSTAGDSRYKICQNLHDSSGGYPLIVREIIGQLS